MSAPTDASTEPTLDGARYLPFLAVFPTLVGLAAHGAARRAAPATTVRESVEDVLATFFVTRLIAREKIGRPVREALAERPDDAPLQRSLEELVTCTRCLGPWAASLITFGRAFAPAHARTITHVAALGGANILLHGWFARVCRQADPPTEH